MFWSGFKILKSTMKFLYHFLINAKSWFLLLNWYLEVTPCKQRFFSSFFSPFILFILLFLCLFRFSLLLFSLFSLYLPFFFSFSSPSNSFSSHHLSFFVFIIALVFVFFYFAIFFSLDCFIFSVFRQNDRTTRLHFLEEAISFRQNSNYARLLFIDLFFLDSYRK